MIPATRASGATRGGGRCTAGRYTLGAQTEAFLELEELINKVRASPELHLASIRYAELVAWVARLDEGRVVPVTKGFASFLHRYLHRGNYGHRDWPILIAKVVQADLDMWNATDFDLTPEQDRAAFVMLLDLLTMYAQGRLKALALNPPSGPLPGDRTDPAGCATEVFTVRQSVEEKYPRALADHPRNRGIDWSAVGKYARGEREALPESWDVFVKADREFDVMWLAGAAPAVSDRLRAVLEPLAGGATEFRPITVNKRTFWFLRVLLVIDAIDMEHSQSRYFEARGTLGTVEIPAWVGNRIPDPCIFLTPQSRVAIWTTPAVVTAYQRSGCNGLSLYPRGAVWWRGDDGTLRPPPGHDA